MSETTLRDLNLCGEDRPACVLLVEDDLSLQRMVRGYLQESSIRTLVASGRETMSRHLAAEQVSLVILDLQLGQEDGLNLLREVRSRSDVPVIIITGYRPAEIDRVVGLELGADDYMTKPFNLRELLARIRAVLRRADSKSTEEPHDPARQSERDGYRFSGWQLNCRTRRLIDPEGVRLVLTKSEYALLLAFLKAPQRPLTREYLLQATRVHEDIFDRSIDVQILRLRRKLEQDPSAPRMIQTERGVGYMFAVPVESP